MNQRNSLLYMPWTVKLADGRMSMKNKKKIFLPNLQHCQFGQDG